VRSAIARALCYNALLALSYTHRLALCYTRRLFTPSRYTRLLTLLTRLLALYTPAIHAVSLHTPRLYTPSYTPACALLQTASDTAPASAVTTLHAFLALCYKGLLVFVHDLGIDSELRESWHRELEARQRRAFRRLPYLSTRQLIIAYVSIRQLTLAYVSGRQHVLRNREVERIYCVT
jgi:hypothetical protein